MSKDNNINWIEFIDKLTDGKICLSVLLTLIAVLALSHFRLIIIENTYKIIVILIFLLSLFLCIIKFILFCSEKIQNKLSIKKYKLRRLNDIFTNIKYSNSQNIKYKYVKEQLIIQFLFKSKLKKFTINTLKSTCVTLNIVQVQQVVNNLARTTYSYLHDDIIYFKNGEYFFHNCIWDELKKYDKNGLLDLN